MTQLLTLLALACGGAGPNTGTDPDAAADGGTASHSGTGDGGLEDGGATDGGATDGGLEDGGATDGGATDGGTGTEALPLLAGAIDVRDGVRLLGAEAGGNLGGAVAAVGDIDGDGIGDLWLAAAEAGSTAARGGAAYLVLGPVTADLEIGSATLTLRGGAEQFLGTSLHRAGDLDGDGVVDLVAGAPEDSILGPEVSPGAGPGRAVIVSGAATGTVGPDGALAVLVGEEDGDKAGCSVAPGGDLDGDGLDEVLVGAYTHSLGARVGGAAYVVSAPLDGQVSLGDADLRLVGTVAGEQVGASVRAVGDVDGDGTGDLLLGADGDEADLPGRAYLVSGGLAGSVAVVDVALATVQSTQDNDNLGSTALGGADLTADGTPDLVLCAYDAEEDGEAVGATYVMAGPFAGTVVAQDSAHTIVRGLTDLAHAGEACAIAGDVDGDGTAELLLGAHKHGIDGEGRAYLFYGAPGGEVRVDAADAIFLGTVPDEDVGWSVGGGDVTGDGFSDVVVAARRYQDSLPAQGAVFVLAGGLHR